MNSKTAKRIRKEASRFPDSIQVVEAIVNGEKQQRIIPLNHENELKEYFRQYGPENYLRHYKEWLIPHHAKMLAKIAELNQANLLPLPELSEDQLFNINLKVNL